MYIDILYTRWECEWWAYARGKIRSRFINTYIYTLYANRVTPIAAAEALCIRYMHAYLLINRCLWLETRASALIYTENGNRFKNESIVAFELVARNNITSTCILLTWLPIWIKHIDVRSLARACIVIDLSTRTFATKNLLYFIKDLLIIMLIPYMYLWVLFRSKTV